MKPVVEAQFAKGDRLFLDLAHESLHLSQVSHLLSITSGGRSGSTTATLVTVPALQNQILGTRLLYGLRYLGLPRRPIRVWRMNDLSGTHGNTL
jgi:hypothetical protein